MKRLVAVVGLFMLTSCSGSNQQATIRDRQLDYQAAYVEPKLTVPNELSDVMVNETLLIPGVNESIAGLYGGSFEPPRSDAALRTSTLPAVRRYQIGGLQWLSIPDSPAAILPELERFIIENKLEIVISKRLNKFQIIESSKFGGTNKHSGSRVRRHFSPEIGLVNLRFLLGSGLRTGTSELRLEIQEEMFDELLAARILDEFKYHLDRRLDEGREVSQALSLIKESKRMTYRQVEGVDMLIVDAEVARVFGVVIDAVRDLGAAVDGSDLEKGLIVARYIRKSTERKLASMTALNRAIASTVVESVGAYQVQIKSSSEGTIVKVHPAGAAASIKGANEIIRELRERLY